MYRILSESGCAELTLKRSRFITHIHPVSTRQQALERVAEHRSQYPDARHVCYGFKIGGGSQVSDQGFSDDGEPAGTAGKPILNVLQHSEVGDLVAIVVRYFGGVKLGAGGLVRAYSGASSQCLAGLETRWYDPPLEQRLQCNYAQESSVRQLLAQHQAKLHHCHYGDQVTLAWSIGQTQASSLSEDLLKLDHRLSPLHTP